MEPDPGGERVAYAWGAVAASISNHRHFIRADLEQPPYGPLNLNTITALTRTGNEYTLTLTSVSEAEFVVAALVGDDAGGPVGDQPVQNDSLDHYGSHGSSCQRASGAERFVSEPSISTPVASG
ncbi:hypothetical protein AB0C89_36530 [Streptomyces sp. NPDC048491]|uniref:hypothetical protein n=1 Tax=Streptomyces sp. NPDC048491 TaxID=3157207 RepID=UPI00341629D2